MSSDDRFRPGWLQAQVALSTAALARIPKGYGGTGQWRSSEAAVEVVSAALAPLSSEPYGDLLCSADRAALVAVAALREAGLLPLLKDDQC